MTAPLATSGEVARSPASHRLRGVLIMTVIGTLQIAYMTLNLTDYGQRMKIADAPFSNNRDAIGSNSGDDFSLAKKESLGFFDDVSSHHWGLLKKKVNDMSPNYSRWAMRDVRNNKMKWFYQAHFEPEFLCPYERRIGRDGDGGKWICDPHRIAEKASEGGPGGGCLVYSVGSNNDFSFEMEVHRQISEHCEIHTFDFGNYAEGAKKAGDYVHYHQVGVGADKPPKFKSLPTLVRELGHENRVIDIFKIDCEGCEWSTAKHWFEAEVTLRQIQVELHYSGKKEQASEFFDLMYENDYVVIHKEPNIAYDGAIEYAFLKLAPEFSKDIVRDKAVGSWVK